MAAPIKAIQKQGLTEEEQKQQKLEDLKELLANNEEALNQMFNIVGELNDIGMLEAANSMLKAKEPIAKIVLGQVTREPVTNLINNMMGAAGALTELNPELTKKLVGSVLTGMDEGNQHLQSNKKVGILDLMKVLKDPDINRAIGFGLHFLKGMGKGLKDE
ncbi:MULTISPECIES: DUF1641 domain-containing protein [Bacillus]|jgi:uncharacterized protein YjgD (DUF1641 family)|uniref:DUF1641 domain-containing protein n=2 Tax=Bacillus cereus group TaxID=86661 RepID=A0A1Y3MIE5_9BACI|nr:MULTISPECIES: DUF1641 domain-containing protein [Bacillus]EEM05879.1 hypothetical protein bmyco0002_16360 [Bacillus pseudomycoides]EEM11567.1 hypothetical protein bmyco0003_16090 [Bacillus pseudomycoides]KFN11754.1 hypothetical protein DJ94_1961 [Bacillus pseudomycoides]MBD5800131.1 hypothetical protein [Bacillus pseudomycoides]MBJ8028504.1 DUF1641 domain-containing protein [Bacillus cereus group sp. N21]